MDIFGHVEAKRKEIEEATKMNIAKSFQENLNPEVEEKKVEKSFDDELNEVHRELFVMTLKRRFMLIRLKTVNLEE